MWQLLVVAFCLFILQFAFSQTEQISKQCELYAISPTNNLVGQNYLKGTYQNDFAGKIGISKHLFASLDGVRSSGGWS